MVKGTQYYVQLEFQGPYGPLEILVPLGRMLASLTWFLASLEFGYGNKHTSTHSNMYIDARFDKSPLSFLTKLLNTYYSK